LRNASIEAAESLHDLLTRILDEIRSVVAKRRGVGTGDTSCVEKGICSPSKKRRRLCPEVSATSIKASMPNALPSMRHAGYCPLDYFLYHGGTSTAGGSAPNCSEHVDRGSLICVSLTDVLGLEVLPRGSANFVCPEVLSCGEALRRDRGSAGCGDLVCVMAGDGLAEACGIRGRRGFDIEASASGQGGGEEMLRACVHRVREELERARLSVTYELRC